MAPPCRNADVNVELYRETHMRSMLKPRLRLPRNGELIQAYTRFIMRWVLCMRQSPIQKAAATIQMGTISIRTSMRATVVGRVY